MSRACLPALRNSARAGRAPSILFTASIQALMVRAGMTAYTASKHGVARPASTLALELAPEGIRVNRLCQGPVDTPSFRRASAAPGAVRPSIADIVDGVPIGRLVGLDEVASATVFLRSHQASAITRVLLPVGGGIAAR